MATNDGLGQFRRKLVSTVKKPAEHYVKALKELAKVREDREDEWKDITRYMVPRKGMFWMTGDYDKPEARRKHKKIIDSTPRKAIRNATAGIMGGMTSKARPWLRLALRDDDLMKDDGVREWLHNTTQALLEAFALSNFYTAAGPWYRELLTYGMPAMMELFDPDTLIRFYSFTNGEWYAAVNERGIVDVFYRRFPMTARNILSQFGEDELSDKIKNDAKDPARQYKYHTICHAIQPNPDADPSKIDNLNMPFESVYWEDQTVTQTLNNLNILGKSGFEEFPVFCPRWETVSTQSVYGDGPGSDELGNCMMLQGLWEDYLKAVHLENNPPMRIPPNYTDSLSLLPGAQNVDPTLKAGGAGQGISKLFDMRFDYKGTFEVIQDVRKQITEGFFNDLFRMLVDRPGLQPPTAFEIAERKAEKIELLSPVLDRIHTEGLVPMVQRTFGIMSRAGAIAEPPEQIQGAELKVEFISTLAQAQKLVGLQSIDLYIGFIGANAELFPSILDKVNSDEMADQYGEVVGIPPKIINDDKTVEAIRDQRAKQVKLKQMMEQMAQGTGMAKDLGVGVDKLTELTEGLA